MLDLDCQRTMLYYTSKTIYNAVVYVLNIPNPMLLSCPLEKPNEGK
jgi:hypothetical protein